MLTRLRLGRLGRMLAPLLVTLVVSASAGAQAPPGPGAPPSASGSPGAAAPATFKPEELQQIAAPLARYPDPLVAQILMASTYPIEIVLATRFVQANAKLTGDQLSEALKREAWDDSVKALVSLPQVLSMMSDKLDWTQKLGDAFLDQKTELMDAIQVLRAKASAEGNLTDTREQRVVTEPAPAPTTAVTTTAPASTTIIKIEPTDPQVIYVPTYSPTVVYGAWPYPAYPPYYYYPPGYAAATAAVSFGVGMAVGAAVWGGCSWGWGHGDVDVDVERHSSFSREVNTSTVASKRSEIQANRTASGKSTWQHNPEHRGGTQYRNEATQQRYNRTGAPNAQSREEFRGRANQARQEAGRSGGSAPSRSATPSGGGASGGAFDGVRDGRQASNFSQRGGSSLSSANRGSVSGGGARGGGARGAGRR